MASEYMEAAGIRKDMLGLLGLWCFFEAIATLEPSSGSKGKGDFQTVRATHPQSQV